MQLVRLGEYMGLNLDMLVSWVVEAPPEPAPVSEPAPPPAGEPAPTEPAPTDSPVATTATVQAPTEAPAAAAEPAPAPDAPPVRMTLTLTSAGAMQTISLEGREAAAMRDYLQSKSGALIR